ncbi:hypothetical protein EMIT0111MI5_10393 [Burkholderia sp. IT-111MI5]
MPVPAESGNRGIAGLRWKARAAGRCGFAWMATGAFRRNSCTGASDAHADSSRRSRRCFRTRATLRVRATARMPTRTATRSKR